MADDLVISVGGDISSLEASLNEIPSVAQDSAAKIQAAFDALPSATDHVEEGLQKISESVATAGTEAATAGQQMTTAFTASAESAGHVSDSLHSIPEAAHEAESSIGLLGEAIKELAGPLLTIEGLKEALIGSSEAFGEFQKASIALKAISGDATAAAEAMERIPAIADRLGVSIVALENAQQRLAAIGVPLERIPGILDGIANAAAAMNTPFEAAQAKFDAMANSGMLMARGLTALGLNMQDIAKQLDMVGQSDKDIKAAFLEIGDAADRAGILAAASMEKFGNVAEQTADGVEGSWNRIKNATHEAMVAVGEALGGFQGITSTVTIAIKGLEDVFLEIIGVLKVVADTVVALSSTMFTAFSGMGSAFADAIKGNFKEAAADLKTMSVEIGSYWQNFTANIQKDWNDTSKAIDKVWSGTSGSVTKSTEAMGEKSDMAAGALKRLAAAHGEAAKAADGQKSAIDQVNDALDKMIQRGIDKNIQDQAKALFDVSDGWKLASQNIKLNQQALDDFAGSALEPVQVFDEATGKAVALANGIEMINGAASKIPTTFDPATTKIVTFDNAMKTIITDAPSLVAALAQVSASAASVGQETTIASEAFAGMAATAGNLGKALDAALTAKLGNINLSLKPGDQVSSPFQIGNPQSFLGLPAGWFSGSGPMGVGRPNEDFTFNPGNNFAVKLHGAADNLNDAATKLQDAATAQQDAAQQAYDAAKAATVAGSRLNAAGEQLSQTNDAISASALAAADAANTAAMAADTAIVTAQGAAGAVATAVQTIAASTALVGATAAAVAPILGFKSGTNTMVPTAPNPVAPQVSGPGGTNTMVMLTPWQGSYSPTVSGQPVAANITVQGDMAMFAQQMFQQFMQQLQAQGVRLVRG